MDIGAREDGKQPDFHIFSEIAKEAFMPLALGGGVNTLEEIEKIIALGSEKVVLNTGAFNMPNLVTEGAKKIGSQSIVVCVDVKMTIWRNFEVVINNAKISTRETATNYIKKLEDLGAGEIILSFVDNEGQREGYNEKLIEEITSITNIPIVVSGGAGSTDDMKKVIQNYGVSVAASEMFTFFGPHRAVLINYPTSKDLDEIVGSK